jgi:hypothetical protein
MYRSAAFGLLFYGLILTIHSQHTVKKDAIAAKFASKLVRAPRLELMGQASGLLCC